MNETHDVSVRTKIFQNTAILIAGRLTGVLLGAAASVVFARYLGTRGFGQFGALYAYLSLFTWLATLGIEPILTRETAKRRQNAGQIIATGMVLCGLFAVLTSVAAILLAPISGYSGEMQKLVVFAAVDMLLLAPLRLPTIIFQVEMKQWYLVSINLARQAFWFGAIVVLERMGYSLPAFVVIRLVGGVLETILILWSSRKFIKGPFRVNLADLVSYLKACAPIAFSSLLSSVYLRVDQVMLHNLASDRALGDYAVAVKVSELFEMLPAALLSSLFPLLAISVSDELKTHAFVDRLFRYMMFTAGLLCVTMCVGARLVISTLYGRQFEQAIPLLSILIWSEFAVFFGSVVIHVLLAKNLQRFLVYPTAVGAALNVALNIVLIPRYSATGSAVASIISYTCAWMIVLLAFSGTREVVWQGLRRAVPVVVVSLAASGLAMLLPIPVVLQAVVGLAGYLVGVWLVRSINREDIAFARSTINRRLLKLS